MNSENTLQLSGPFQVFDSSGRAWDIESLRIFDESYGIIDIYVQFVHSMDDDPLYEDARLIGQILDRLRSLGYVGPDFGHGDLGLQDEKLIVLEAPEEFGVFAASKGWKNLAEEYADNADFDEAGHSYGGSAEAGPSKLFTALMQKLKAK